MIKNKIVLKILFYLAKIENQKILYFVNSLIIFFYKKIIFNLLNLFFKKKIIFIYRHSLKDEYNFHFALSDIDFTAIVLTDEENNIKRVISIYYILKYLIPSVGEIEIYTKKEYERYNEILTSIQSIYENLRLYRKVWWMQYAISIAPSDYHKLKAIRSIKSCLLKINHNLIYNEKDNVLNLSPYLEDYIEKILPGVSTSLRYTNLTTKAEIYCPYMGVKIELSNILLKENSLCLDTKKGLVLLAITPVSYKSNSEHEKIIQMLRSKTDVFLIWSKLTELEYIIFNAFSRSYLAEEPWITKWKFCLSDALGQVNKMNVKKY
jgi:hypothetical protein